MNIDTAAQQLALRYAQLVDDREFAELEEILFEDFKQESQQFSSSSAAEFIAGLEILRNYDRTFHLIGNQYGKWEGEQYQGETYCVASHLYSKEGVDRKLDMGIRYKDTIEKRDGVFKFSRRDLDIVWVQDLPTML